MAKFVEKKNLKPLKSANNANRNTADGVLVSENGYIVTCCHGNKDGTLELQINDNYFVVFPDTIRDCLNLKLAVNIKKKDVLWILPCYPRQVRSRYGVGLKKHNIKIACNNWNGITTFVTYKNGVSLKENTMRNPIFSKDVISFIIGKQQDIQLAISNGKIT